MRRSPKLPMHSCVGTAALMDVRRDAAGASLARGRFLNARHAGGQVVQVMSLANLAARVLHASARTYRITDILVYV